MSEDRLPQIRLGPDGLAVGVQGLGCMGMSEFYGDTDEAAARGTLETALAHGVTLFDTADMYGQGANERFLSPFVRDHREQVVIATKFGTVRAADGAMSVRNDPRYIRDAVEGSLSRLGVDVIDPYTMHRRDPQVPLADSVGTMADLVSEGKVRHLGLSEVTGDELRQAHAIHPIAAVQSEWSLFTRDIERTLVPAAAVLGVGVVPYSPLGRGFLTGALPTELDAGDVRTVFPRFTGDNARRNANLLAPIADIASVRGLSMAQIALAWLHQQAAVHGVAIVPIPGTRRAARLQENLAAVAVTLTADELVRLDSLAEQVAGDRYPDMRQTASARESLTTARSASPIAATNTLPATASSGPSTSPTTRTEQA